MYRKPIAFAWKIMPPWLRLRIVRATQVRFTVSAAAIIMNEERKVLLLNHMLRPYSGWGMPGGFMSAAEQPEEAIRRELHEETGIELLDLKLFRVRTIGSHIEILFTARAGGDPVVSSREILELGWFDVDSMPENMSNAQKAVIRQALGTES